ncbi:Mobile element protein [Desulfosporosinus sp. I2]|nr:Mobile element protein [Desulfosporosinus sp. I2]
MADSYRKQLDDPSFKDLSFEERFGLMVDTEWARRKNNKLAVLFENQNSILAMLASRI